METKCTKSSKLLGLKKLKDKLLNLNPLYNRKIRFYISKNLTWDLSELLNKSDVGSAIEFSTSILNLLINNRKDESGLSLDLEKLFKPLTLENVEKLQKKVRHLQKKNLAVYQEKGYKALFLGAVFVRGYFCNNKGSLRLVNAPLFFLPCDLEKIKNLSLVFRSERKINYSLLYYLQKELGTGKEKLTNFLNKLKNSEGVEKREDYFSFLIQEFQNWLSSTRIKIKLSPATSSLVEKGRNCFSTENENREEEKKESNISPFVDQHLTINDNNGLIGQIISKESRRVYQKGNYYGNIIYILKVEWEKNDPKNLQQNPEVVFVYPNLVSEEVITSIKQNNFINKRYLLFCEKKSKRWVLHAWQEVAENSGYLFNQEKNYFQPEPFIKLLISNKSKNYPENQLEIALNFCLTIDSEPNLSLFCNFEEIIAEYSQERTINWSKSALDLLRGKVESVVSYPQTGKQIAKPLYLPFESDPSQTYILKKIFRNFSENFLCIDGPPGTGKSQLICNLLANALAYHKKVLVVCEKDVALKVIYNKLSSIGLNQSVIKVNELAQTSKIYQNILNNLKNNQQTRTNRHVYFGDIEKQIVISEERLTANLRKISNYCQIENEFQICRQIPLQEVYLKFDSKHQPSPTLIQLNTGIENKEQLDKLKNNLENYTSKFSKIFEKWKPICLQLKNTFLKNNRLGFEFNWENKNKFLETTNNLLQQLKSKKTENSLLSQIKYIKLIQEHSKNHQSIALLESKIKVLKELQKNYQDFFTFLQIENFTDFWQKCSDEKFLISIQQFISEEFLTIGELHFALNNFDENTKKNIEYFLSKILVEQEFNHLNTHVIKEYEQAIYFNWIKEIEEENKEVLIYWNQNELVRIQREQQEIIKRKNGLAKEVLKNKQKENLDKLSTNYSLLRELSKKRKISALKKFFPELINYFPIWLTTPEVIAGITNMHETPFDFLVFDEASQVPLEKSIPLWSRAKKCIVIGDEQQLPPTDFFKSHLENDEEIWEKEEEEKTLKEMEENINLELDDLDKNNNLLSYAKKYARNREKLTLLYHYRSKYPELIEFSNQAFYDGILQIVSASELKKKNYVSPIEYHYLPEGRWIDTENEIEARYIINLLKKLDSKKEIGIITFNVKQQNKIIEYIDEKNQYENLFIKNLEEVQGDERDIIIFSVCYGPDEKGKIKLNFGPLSKEGGEKRLNVAISRAREKVIVVSSLLPNDLNRIIEEDENRKLGPKLFKKYLEYAYYCEKNQSENVQEILEKSLPKIVNTSLDETPEEKKEFGSLFEKQVYNELCNELIKEDGGYEIHRQVKSVGYCIDLAIWDNKVQQYILGIECDGEYWHSKIEHVERDIYRQQLLENKGWTITRILSRDWCRNKEKEVERVSKKLKELKLA